MRDMSNRESDIATARSPREYRRWLHGFAVLFVVATLGLLVLGGTVTSKGVGLAVPDWPTTFEYNMFLFPPSMWKGGVFWEHTHRLMGSLIGLMTIVVAVWLWRTQGQRPWLRRLGVAALVLVIIQGVMGGLRVTQLSITLAIVHGVTAQVFFCITVLIAAATSRWWVQSKQKSRRAKKQKSGAIGGLAAALGPTVPSAAREAGELRGLRIAAIVLLAALFIQLILGAVMRHTGSGLAIPDFPASFGQVVPPLSQGAIDEAERRLPYEEVALIEQAVQAAAHSDERYFQPWRVGLAFAHRAWAAVVGLIAAWLVVAVLRRASHVRLLLSPAIAIAALLLVQVALGAAIIWTVRHPEVATAHQTIGAVTLATVFLLLLRLHTVPIPRRAAAAARESGAKAGLARVQGAGA